MSVYQRFSQRCYLSVNVSACVATHIYGEIIFASHRTRIATGISRGLAPSVALHLADETDICDRMRGFFACSFEIWVRLRNACVRKYDCASSIAMFQSEMSSIFNFHEEEARFLACLLNQ